MNNSWEESGFGSHEDRIARLERIAQGQHDTDSTGNALLGKVDSLDQSARRLSVSTEALMKTRRILNVVTGVGFVLLAGPLATAIALVYLQQNSAEACQQRAIAAKAIEFFVESENERISTLNILTPEQKLERAANLEDLQRGFPPVNCP